MLISLRIHHVALIDDLEIPFRQGFHVLSGETGAGKSIVVDAVNLVLGGRADRELIRYGSEKAWVEAAFDAVDAPQALALLREHAIDCEDGMITLFREITRSGRNLCRINGITMQLSVLRQAAALLMDIHGQHEHQFLMDAKYHLAALDHSGGASHARLLAQTEAAYQRFIANHRAYAKLVKENQEKTYRMEQLKRSLAELEKAALTAGEEEQLIAERELLRNAGKSAEAIQSAQAALSYGELQDGALTRAKLALEALRTVEALGEPYQTLAQRYANAYYELEELAFEIARLADQQEYDPDRLEWIEGRLDLIRRLERKYGDSVEAILAEQERLQQAYDRYTSMDQQVQEMGAEHKRLLAAYRAQAKTLTEARRALAVTFEQSMMAQLAELGMEKTVFQVAFLPHEEGKAVMPQPTGDDQLAFFIAPNPGEPMKPLSKIASGGELSRLMLAIKSLEAAQDGVGTMVFDEIDTGISGRMAQVVAEKMAAIARYRQVICVSHLPQIAAMADDQYRVQKHTEAGRTFTVVQRLNPQERVEEIARMLGGADGSGDSARSHALHMLQKAESSKD